ncbi:hypothetical protein BDD12DRAFT_118248 [Trichophaea hybrida]|nr:hypothetical protein BDD12DRAFT_118248 [Trichophaea hybrida]
MKARLHDILRSNALFSSFSRAYEFPDKLLREKEAQGPMGFKVEADIFEAAVGGLFEDGAGEERGWIQLQTWFEVLIEPWIDWTIARLDPALRDSYLTFNRVPLDKKSQSPLNPKGLVLPKITRRDRKILKPTTPLTRSRKGAKFLPPKPPKPPKQPKKKKPKLSKARNLVPYVPPQMAVQQYAAPNMAMVNAEQPHAGSAERRWEHLASIGHHPPQTYAANQNMQHWGYGQTRNYTMLPDVRLPENQIFLQQQQQQQQLHQPPTTHGAPGLIYDSYP